MSPKLAKRIRNIYDPKAEVPYQLSRSKIDLFVECPRCFYLDRKLGVGRPDMPGFTLNIAVDHLLKKEFDIHRANKEAHPLMKQYGIKAVPFEHVDFKKCLDSLEIPVASEKCKYCSYVFTRLEVEE